MYKYIYICIYIRVFTLCIWLYIYGSFLKWGYHYSYHPFSIGIFHCKPSIWVLGGRAFQVELRGLIRRFASSMSRSKNGEVTGFEVHNLGESGESGIVIHESGRIWALSELTSPTLRFLSEMIILVAPSLAVFVDPRPGPRVVAAGHIRPTWASESLDASRHCGIRRWILIIHIYTMDPCSMYIWAEIMRTYSKDSV